MTIPTDYAERVYAGVLGKLIGVYLGRPFEGWTYEKISGRFGEVNYYVHEEMDVPLIVTDDDISGTLTFCAPCLTTASAAKSRPRRSARAG